METSKVMGQNQSENDNQYTAIYVKNPADMLYPWMINPAFLPIITTHAITFLVGLLGNSVVIITWAGRGKLRSPTAAFLVSLAVADLLLLLVYVPLEITQYFVVTWDSKGTVCKLTSYVEMLSGMASVLNLVAVSFERFLVIVYPMKARRFCTMSKSRKGLVVVWFSAIILASPVLITKNAHPITYYNNETSVTAYYCWDVNDNMALYIAVYQLLIMFVVPAILMLFCYFCVIQELWSSTKVMSNMTRTSRQMVHSPTSVSAILLEQSGQKTTICTYSKNTPGSANSTPSLRRKATSRSGGADVKRVRQQVIKMLLFVIIIFLICWGPRLVMNIVIKIGLESFTQYIYSIRVACYLLSFIHSALNPFVYGFMSSNFRQMMLSTCGTGRGNTHHQGNVDPVANHHIIGCVSIKHLLTTSRHRRSSDLCEPSCNGTSNVTIPLSVNINGFVTPATSSPSVRTRAV